MKYKQQPQGVSILIIDDRPQDVKIMVNFLQEKGYTTRVAITPQFAFKTIEESLPQLILLDICMPGVDGYEICQKLKANEHTREIPVIFLTGVDEIESRIRAFQEGAVDYIVKPFSPQEVLMRVHTHTSISQLRQRLQEEVDRFHFLENASSEGLLFYENDEIIECNQTASQIFNIPQQQILHKKLSEILPEKPIPLEENIGYETKGYRPDGTFISLEILSRTIVQQGQKIKVLAVRNIEYKKHIQQLETENLHLRTEISTRNKLGKLIGKSSAIRKVYEQIIKIAACDETVIIYGETGTGKELVARTIFEMSKRNGCPFIPLNCATLQETLFETQFFGHRQGAFTGAVSSNKGYYQEAEGGVLFLDEIADLPLSLQSKLLRVLEDGEYFTVGDSKTRKSNVRIIAATNIDFNKLLETGRVRKDFFHRINVLSISIPPLRERKEDISILTEHFLEKYACKHGSLKLPPQILEQFINYNWPGNVRELFNELRRYIAGANVELDNNSINTVQNSPQPISQTFYTQIESYERQILAQTLKMANNNKTKTAELLSLPMMTLRRKLKKYDLDTMH